jgi:nicotinamide mononucleotide transporter
MDIASLVDQFVRDIQYTRWQEWVSTGTQIASVWYARKNNILVYPTGIIGVLLAAWMYFFIAHPPLYADGVLNIYYLLMSIYGWYNWTKVKTDHHFVFEISWCTKKELIAGMLWFVGAWISIYVILVSLTNSNTPVLDSLVSASAVTAMWWMARRKIENWIAWICSNLVAIPLNFYKGFMLFTLMYVLFLIMAYFGYKEWTKAVQKQTNLLS